MAVSIYFRVLFVVPKRDLVKGGIRIVKAHIFHFQRSAVFNIRIDRTDVQEPRHTPERE